MELLFPFLVFSPDIFFFNEIKKKTKKDFFSQFVYLNKSHL